MKIFDTANIREADRLTITRQSITSYDLMERAANEAFLWLKNRFTDKETVFHVFCGKGNNGGDGLVIARLLHENHNYTVHLNIVGEGNPSEDFNKALELATAAGMQYNKPVDIQNGDLRKAIIIDALFGIGLSRELNDEFKNTIDYINNSEAFIVSIDVPSGMFLDRPTSHAVEADVVLTFQCPKLAFFLTHNYRFIKDIEVIDIGLDKEFINNAESFIHYIDRFEACARFKEIPYYAHKGTQGHALIIGGSYGKIGAVNLAARAALKSGCGLVTAYVPECGYIPLQSSFPEAMVLTDSERHITKINFDLQPKAIGIGPGLGMHHETQQALLDFFQENKIPLVIDADALNILSENRGYLKFLPENSILSPHPKELQRLIGAWEDDFDKLEKLKDFSKEYNCIIVVKDARTIVVHHDHLYINSTGNAALATGGSGDVLTGIITGLVAQGYDPVDAAILGVYLHGKSADTGINKTGMHSFTASSVLDYLGEAWLQVQALQ